MITVYSRAVEFCVVESHSSNRIVSSSKHPITILEFPMSTARIIKTSFRPFSVLACTGYRRIPYSTVARISAKVNAGIRAFVCLELQEFLLYTIRIGFSLLYGLYGCMEACDWFLGANNYVRTNKYSAECADVL